MGEWEGGRGCGGERMDSRGVFVVLNFNVLIVNFKCYYEFWT